MEEPLITTELENVLLRMHFEPADEQVVRASDVVVEERELTRREARRCLDVLYDVNREFLHIELGLI